MEMKKKTELSNYGNFPAFFHGRMAMISDYIAWKKILVTKIFPPKAHKNSFSLTLGHTKLT
jgi:hypothetical protein